MLLALGPDYPPTMLYTGMALQAQGKLDEAHSIWQETVRLVPESPAGKDASQCLSRLPTGAASL